MTPQEQAEAKAALDRFLADNPELEELSARLATFNIFRALKVETEEIRHSNTLAWLLDPKGSHGLGDVVLRRVMSNILLESGEKAPSLSAAEVELLDFSDVEVRREWHHFDLLVIVHASDPVVVLIENKVRSGVSKKQLERYYKDAQKEFPAARMLPVLLTLEERGEEAEELSPWIPYSYSQLLRVIERIRGQRHRQLAVPVATFLSHYEETLRRLTMQDKAITDLCRAIYRKHREAIDLIVEHGAVSRFQDVVTVVLSEGKQHEILVVKPGMVFFTPLVWKDLVPKWWVYCWLQKLRRGGIHLGLEVGKMADSKLRLACVQALSEAGFGLSKLAFRPDATYSRFFTATEKVVDFDDEEGIRNAAEALLKKAEAQIAKATNVFKVVFKDARSDK